jgi:hypothetical protein
MRTRTVLSKENNMLTQQEIAYGQQKNREHIWSQCEIDFEEEHGLKSKSWQDDDQDWLDNRYMELCDEAKITPW